MNEKKDTLDILSKSTSIVEGIINIIKQVRFIVPYFFTVVVPTIVGLVSKNIILTILVVIGAVVVLILLSVLMGKMYKGRVKGTFAVSAFILYGRENKLLLFRKEANEEFYVQPSLTYKTRYGYHWEDKLETPYKIIMDYLNKYLYMEHLHLINGTALKYDYRNGEQKLSNFLRDNATKLYNRKFNQNSVEDSMYNYRNNGISPSPLLTVVENNQDTLKNSKEPVHIDFYYAFQLEQKNRNINKGLTEKNYKLVSREELEKMIEEKKTHGDLLAVYDILLFAVNRIKARPEVRINDCTFTRRKKTAYWRITESCNCNCEYCFLAQNKTESVSSVGEEVIERVINIIEENDIEKLVISGGEPLLVSNLCEIVNKVSKAQVDNLKISICTNGLIEFENFDQLMKNKQFEKFVVSLDGHSQETYGKFKRKVNRKPAEFKKVLQFIQRARENNIRVAINVILSHMLKKNIDDYIRIINECAVEELSISTLIPNNARNKGTSKYLSKMSEIFEFYNQMVNEKVNKFECLEKLDFIVPNCVFSNGKCDSMEKGNLFYISPDGKKILGCAEREAMLMERG